MIAAQQMCQRSMDGIEVEMGVLLIFFLGEVSLKRIDQTYRAVFVVTGHESKMVCKQHLPPRTCLEQTEKETKKIYKDKSEGNRRIGEGKEE